MLFAIDIGNSNIHVGIFESDVLRHTFRLGTDADRTSDEYALLLKSITELGGFSTSAFDGIIIGSVVPSVTETIISAVKKIINVPVMTVGPGIKTGFPIKLDDPSELGADLTANAAGAISKLGSPAIVADFGTATAICVIGENKEYLGGCIMPGIQMSLNALHNAELLPGVSPESTVGILGKNTRQCMLSGVIRGEAMAVCGFIEEY
ncbi:MAG: type III pantothenate kinase, partial [Eubacteriales bacterium]